MSEANPFRPASVIGVITAGLISFAAFVILLGWGGDGFGRGNGTASPSSAAATGFKALVELTDQYIPTRFARGQAELETDDLLVVTLETNSKPQDVERLLRNRTGRATVLVLPKWKIVRHERRGDWVRTNGPWENRAADQLMGEQYDVKLLMGRKRAVGIQSLDFMEGVKVSLSNSPQVIDGDDVTMLIGIPGEGALVAQLGDEPHYVVADPDLLNNHGLSRLESADAAVEILVRLMPDTDASIVFAAGAGGGTGRNLIRTLFEPPFLAMTLALLIATLLAGLHGAARFGPARRAARAIPFGKAALVENSASLVRLARREVRLGGGYADVVRDDAARAGAAPANLQGEALDAYLDRFTKPGEPAFSPLAHDVRNARDRSELVAAARALFRWKKDMIR